MKISMMMLLSATCFSSADITMLTVGNADIIANGSNISAGAVVSTTVSGQYIDSDNGNAVVGTWILSLSTTAVDVALTSTISRATTVNNDGRIRVTNQLLNINTTYNLQSTVNAGYEVASVFVDSSSAGDFSRPNSVIGVALDKDATWATTNSTFTGFNWSENGSATTQTGAQLNGTTVIADTVLSTEDYLAGESGEGIWGFQVDNIDSQAYTFDFTYSELGGIQDTASDSFVLDVTVVAVPEPSSIFLLASGLGICLLRRSRT